MFQEMRWPGVVLLVLLAGCAVARADAPAPTPARSITPTSVLEFRTLPDGAVVLELKLDRGWLELFPRRRFRDDFCLLGGRCEELHEPRNCLVADGLAECDPDPRLRPLPTRPRLSR